MEINSSTETKIKQLIETNEFSEVFFLLEGILQKCSSNGRYKNDRNDLIMYKSQFHEVKRSENINKLSTEEIQIIKNNIRNSLLEFIDYLVEKVNTNSELNSSNSLNKIEYSTITLIIDKDISEYSYEGRIKLLKTIEELLKLDGSIKINRIMKGSIKMEIEIPKKKVGELIKIIEKGELKKFHISNYLYTPKKESESRKKGIKHFSERIFGKITGTIVNFRSSPEIKVSNKIGRLFRDTKVEVIGYRIIKGFKEDKITLEETLFIPIEESRTPLSLEKGVALKYIKDAENGYSQVLRYTKENEVQEGFVKTIDLKNIENKKWYKIKFKDIEGWIYGSYVDFHF